VRDFVSEPHTAIVGEPQGEIMNLVDAKASPAQSALLEIVREQPERTLSEVKGLAIGNRQLAISSLDETHTNHDLSRTANCLLRGASSSRRLELPRHHDVRASDVDLKRLGAVLALAYEREFHDFAELLLLEKLGPRTLQSLALVAEVVHGTPTRFADPARFSFAHGGKDGHPFPVPLKTYDQSISVLRRSLDAAKLGYTEKLGGFKRLDRFVRRIEREVSPRADLDAVVSHEKKISPVLGGRTAFGVRRSKQAGSKQLELF
jgi:hypothetical protein